MLTIYALASLPYDYADVHNSVSMTSQTVIDTMMFGPQGMPFEMPCALPDNNLQVPCTTANAAPVHMKTTAAVFGPYGGIDKHIVMWSVTIEATVDVESGCPGCLLEFSNGNGGSFISTGVYTWARAASDYNTMFFYLPEDVTGGDVNAIISIGDTLTVRSIVDDRAGNKGKTPDHQQVRADFPSLVAARYIRLRPLAFYTGSYSDRQYGMRAGLVVGKDAGSENMFVGRHHFRRCIVTDGYTRLVHVGSSPSESSKTVNCDGCYECREMPDHPGWGWGPYSRPTESGFNLFLSEPGTVSTTLKAKLPHPTSLSWNGPQLSTWVHELDVLCRIDPAYGNGPLAPMLDADAEWTTFMQPSATGSPLEALKDGFSPPAAAAAFRSTTLENVAAVYRPGDQLDPTSVSPFENPDFHDLHPLFKPPSSAQSSGGGSDDVWWPPKQAFKVTFQPAFADPWTSADRVSTLATESETDGWYLDHGNDYGTHANSVSGSTADFGWRCKPYLSWHGSGYLIDKEYSKPAYSWGVVKDVGVHRTSVGNGVSLPHCPDGKPNMWEVAVPNGVYMVTIGHAMDLNNPSFDGCTYENVKPISQVALVDSDHHSRCTTAGIKKDSPLFFLPK